MCDNDGLRDKGYTRHNSDAGQQPEHHRARHENIMGLIDVASFSRGRWVAPAAAATTLCDAATGEAIARAGGAELDLAAMREYATQVGGPALRGMTLHERANMVKALAGRLDANKAPLFALSHMTGATRADSSIDIDGGIGAMFTLSSKTRRELPDGTVLLDGRLEQLSKGASFMGQHIATPLHGVAVHINAFNFPVWGMLEKLAPALIAGVPAIVKPATATSYLAEAAFRLMAESDILPAGAVQLVAGRLESRKSGALLALLGPQDAVSFTGSSATAHRLRLEDGIVRNAVRFTAEQDSLNASILGPDIGAGDPEFALFIKEVCREITVKAGQKCTAVRRVMVPDAMRGAVAEALVAGLETVVVGDPRLDEVRMGALVDTAQKRDVMAKCADFEKEARRITGAGRPRLAGENLAGGAFMAPTLFDCADADGATAIHTSEAFGPVACMMGYRSLAHAAGLANRGGGALVTSVITRDAGVARELVAQSASHHGRLYFNNRDSMAESTGHGAPLPHLVHGGPGRAGGGEELGGVRALSHYMQRTAVQGPPGLLAQLGGGWLAGGDTTKTRTHPFTRRFDDLVPGQCLEVGPRTVTADDIARFADFTGDRFYAHTDARAAAANPFFDGIVAHGYLLLSFAAGMFVDPAPGPVLANTGLEGLRFTKPVPAGTAITVRLVVKDKALRNEEYGEVRWHVEIRDDCDDIVASYELLTMVAR